MLRFSFAVACVCALLLIVTTPAGAYQPGIGLKPATCYLPVKPGLCKAYIPSWYYDVRRDACFFFVYGGCRGNANRFGTKETCERVCKPRRHNVVDPWSYEDDSYQEDERPQLFPSSDEYNPRLPYTKPYTYDRE